MKIRKPHALVTQRINVRRFDVGMPVAAEITVSQVIRHDEDDVRFFRTAGPWGEDAADHQAVEQGDPGGKWAATHLTFY